MAGGTTVLVDVTELEPELRNVDALARLQLCALRHGRRIELRGASRELCELIELAGLSDALPLEKGGSIDSWH